jgi:hypothetical protein
MLLASTRIFADETVVPARARLRPRPDQTALLLGDAEAKVRPRSRWNAREGIARDDRPSGGSSPPAAGLRLRAWQRAYPRMGGKVDGVAMLGQGGAPNFLQNRV